MSASQPKKGAGSKKGAREEIKLKTSASKSQIANAAPKLTPKLTPKRKGSPAKRKPKGSAGQTDETPRLPAGEEAIPESHGGPKEQGESSPQASRVQEENVGRAHQAETTPAVQEWPVPNIREDWEALSTGRGSNDGVEAWVATPRGGFSIATPPPPAVSSDEGAISDDEQRVQAKRDIRAFIQKKREAHEQAAQLEAIAAASAAADEQKRAQARRDLRAFIEKKRNAHNEQGAQAEAAQLDAIASAEAGADENKRTQARQDLRLFIQKKRDAYQDDEGDSMYGENELLPRPRVV